MSATEELRRLLDECGVEWAIPDESWNQDSITYWKVGSIKWVAFESENGTLWLNCNSVTDLTPEQAIAATVGRGMCRMTLCAAGNDYARYRCSECEQETMTPRVLVEGVSCGYERPTYCVNCGRKVV